MIVLRKLFRLVLLLVFSLRGYMWGGVVGVLIGLVLSGPLAFLLLRTSERNKTVHLFAEWTICSALIFIAAYPSLLGAEIGSMCNQHVDSLLLQRRVYRILEPEEYSQIEPRFDFRKFYGIEFCGNVRDNDSFQAFRIKVVDSFPEVSPKWIWWDIHLDSENTDIVENEYQLRLQTD